MDTHSRVFPFFSNLLHGIWVRFSDYSSSGSTDEPANIDVDACTYCDDTRAYVSVYALCHISLVIVTVLPQVVLVTVASPAAVLLVRFPWIETFLTASTNPSLKDYPAAPAPPTSSTLVFYPTVIATMQPCTLIGMCVTAQSSVHLGRMAVTRMSTGLLAVIDLSLYEQLYNWTQRVQKQV